MAVEVVGFVFGLLTMCGLGFVFLSHERGKVIEAAYARDNDLRRNALIWPSR